MELRDSIEFLKSLPDQFYVVTDIDGKTVWASPKFCELTGYSLEEFIGKKPGTILQGKETSKKTIEYIRHKLKKKEAFTSEILNYTKQGSAYFTHINCKPIFDEQNNPIGFIACEHDVTKLYDQKRINSEMVRLLEETSKTAKVGGWEVDLETMNPIWSKEVYRIHEVDPNTKPDLDEAINFYAPEHRQIIIDSINKALKEGSGWDHELNIITAKGNCIRVRAIGHIDMKDGKPVRMYGTFQDINERYLAEQEYNLVSERLRHVSKNSMIGVWDWDVKNNQLVWDDVMYDLYHIKNNQYEGAFQAWQAALHPEDFKLANQSIQDAVDNNIPFDTTFRIIWPDTKEVRYIRALAHSFKNSDGKVYRLLGSNWDITEQKEIEGKLEIALKDAQAGLRSRNRFLAMMSHEIRTPLNGIIGSLQLMKHENLTEQQSELLNILFDSSDVLLNTINDIIDLSKIDSGKLEIKNDVFSLPQLIKEIENFEKPLFEKSKLSFLLDCDINIPEFVIGDKNRIKQILINLFNNAIKFTEEGGIEFRIKVLSKKTNSVTLLFSVKDSGIGIPKENVDDIFHEFTQIESGLQRKYVGSGLGLNICQILAHQMNGHLRCESEENKGSTFYYELNLEFLKKYKQDEQQDLNIKLPSQLKVLIAEDNLVNQKIIKKMLKKLNIEDVKICNDGHEIIKASESQEYDVLLMDIQMPNLNGLDAMKLIRGKNDNLNSRKPIIAVTANAMAGDRENYLKNGFSETISKPIDLMNLKKTLFTVLNP